MSKGLEARRSNVSSRSVVRVAKIIYSLALSFSTGEAGNVGLVDMVDVGQVSYPRSKLAACAHGHWVRF